MAARAAQDNQLSDKDHQLHLSAIYSTDRAVLKSIMTSLQKSRKPTLKTEPAKQEVKEIVASTTPKQVVESKPTLFAKEETIPTVVNSLTGDALFDEVMHDIEILKDRKHQFELAVETHEKGLPFPTTEIKSKKVKSVTDPDEGLLLEIKTSKKKIKPEGPKQKEQIEIIDQFIKTQPNISKNKLVPTPANESKDDLSENSLTYGDNIVSETLVQILLKQGKKEKAIEVLKKLIWKFPQKKAYFAAQIEDLKK